MVQPVIAKLVELAMDLVAEKEKIILAAALADGNGSSTSGAGNNGGGRDHAMDASASQSGDGSTTRTIHNINREYIFHEEYSCIMRACAQEIAVEMARKG